MALTWDEIKGNALSFSRKWKDAIDEEAEAQSFLNDFFGIFGINRKQVATFEKRVDMGDHRGYIDLFWKGVILIEMKSRGKDLDKAYTQAKDYAFNLAEGEHPKYLMVSDFETIRLYDHENDRRVDFKTADLHKHIRKFEGLINRRAVLEISEEDLELNVKAAYQMAKIHDRLKDLGYTGHELEVYLVRMVFCLFAEDTGIFNENSFRNYINNSKEDGSDLARKIQELFEYLDTSPEERKKRSNLFSDDLQDPRNNFVYVNGSLFREILRSARFDTKMRLILLECTSFNWGDISPAIFGAMFQGVMNPEERRELGAHYTSEKNILKLIRPLFLDELWDEFEKSRVNVKTLNAFHEKLSSLKFLDPACGCGNFLIITYRELRKLEFEVLKVLYPNQSQMVLDISDYCRVNVNQFYGIECEEFPCQIAHVGMWLVDHLRNMIISKHYGFYYKRLPLTTTATIIHGNALTIDWDSIVPKNELNFILGNPPFVGARMMNPAQKEDINQVFGKLKGVGNLDYVTAWYKKAVQYMMGTDQKAAFVSTNSISQGEQPGILWKSLYQDGSCNINFGYRTFKWSNDAKGKAAVHCVIIGFDTIDEKKKTKQIFDENGICKSATNINPYLIDAPNVLIERKSNPLCDVPPMNFGSMPNDGGFLILSKEERDALLSKYPQSEKYVRKFMMGNEFIKKIDRYCLWLINASPSELRDIPEIAERVANVRKVRSQSPRTVTQALANTPTLFGENRQPTEKYIAIPEVSSEKRYYTPIGFSSPDIIAGNTLLVVPNATLYHFGILTSSFHMAWMRVVCGRLKSDYRYSALLVYNNFPWPHSTEKQKEIIEKSAQRVLEIREKFLDNSFADLYDPNFMPPELLKAHQSLDIVVNEAYGGHKFSYESEIVAYLMQLYQKLV